MEKLCTTSKVNTFFEDPRQNTEPSSKRIGTLLSKVLIALTVPSKVGDDTTETVQ